MKSKFKNVLIVIGILVFIASIVANVFLYLENNNRLWNVEFQDANSRNTYFTIHNIKQAQRISKGKGIKVGILDHCFGYEVHKTLYSGAVDFTNNPEALNKVDEHGYWMANVLKEVAPDCEVYALNTVYMKSEDDTVTAVIHAIDWAIKNHIDILTYSQEPVSDKNRKRFDAAVDKAVKNNIVTTFIHYDNPNNIWPQAMAAPNCVEEGQRKPDITIFPYDYNTLLLDTYTKNMKHKNKVNSGDDIPYYSVSATSPVTAGFIAMLKSINNKLTSDEYRQILKKTSYTSDFKDPFTLKNVQCQGVVDIGKAAQYIKENY